MSLTACFFALKNSSDKIKISATQASTPGVSQPDDTVRHLQTEITAN